MNKNNWLIEKAPPVAPRPRGLISFFAHSFSYIFHPLFLTLYVAFFLIYIHPVYFSGFSHTEKKQVLFIILLNSVFFPVITVLLLKGLGFVQSIFLKTQKDRIIPYIACGIFFFWNYLVFKKQDFYPTILTCFILGTFLAASAGLIANIYFKISMHAIGMGGTIGIGLLVMKSNTMLMTWPLCIALLVSGLVCTSRLLLGTHTPKDIYSGLAIGILCQFAAAVVIL